MDFTKFSEADKLYTPSLSLWALREDMMGLHFKFASEETEKVRNTIPCSLNLPYGKRARQKYDIYGIDLPNDAPIFIYIHGGYWQAMNKNECGYIVQPLHKHKIKSFIIGYSLCPEVTVHEIVLEIEAAVKKCIEYAQKYGSKGIYLSGFSAGTHLAALLFSTLLPKLKPEERSLIKAAILICGIYDITPLIETYFNEPLKLNLEEATRLSPMFQTVPKMNLKVHIFVGSRDSPAFIKQAELYYEKIKPILHTTFKVIDDVDHMSIVEKMCDENYELVKFLADLMHKKH